MNEIVSDMKNRSNFDLTLDVHLESTLRSATESWMSSHANARYDMYD